MLSRVKEYINDTKYKVIVSEEEIYVLNYSKIITFSDDLILIDLDNRILTIKGKNIVINKLLDSEVLIKGKIKSIEIR